MKKQEDVLAIVEELKKLYPDGLCSLEYEKDYELLFSVRLAAQCTDERVNKVTPALYARFPTLQALAEADVKFHDVIYEATHNRRLVQLLNNLREQMYRYRMEYMKDAPSRKLLDAEHKEICCAVRGGDVDRARKFVCAHIDNQEKAIIESLKNQ